MPACVRTCAAWHRNTPRPCTTTPCRIGHSLSAHSRAIHPSRRLLQRLQHLPVTDQLLSSFHQLPMRHPAYQHWTLPEPRQAVRGLEAVPAQMLGCGWCHSVPGISSRSRMTWRPVVHPPHSTRQWCSRPPPCHQPRSSGVAARSLCRTLMGGLQQKRARHRSTYSQVYRQTCGRPVRYGPQHLACHLF